MSSSPKIPKELMLECALKILIRDGYAALNIKAVAKEIGCSTQPISWHFGNMDGFRNELTKYALAYANKKMLSNASNGMEFFSNIGTAYISLAFDEPNLFKYLYMTGESGYQAGGFDVLVNTGENAIMADQIADYLKIPRESVSRFIRNTMIYTHGLACFVASGVITSSKKEVIEMVNQAAHNFSLNTGTKIDKESDNERK